ncbi:MAG: hypothetical protein A2234_09840 [Elusimicrobia bacterium RIFOXYA2_FULL_58_8]|nr:MAG: hypothetical protein A2285_03245 [Elusimicrobia bacterium RIFOXYA12_FULL_57_11]OGS13405.1 MAG: hypothetical protein A2234_09840 [Elusimicrobia bacterium RIFOXYA2_FULL_58_8]
MDFIHELKDRTVFIVGSQKNAGKTTFLNYAMNRLRGTGSMGAFSIGVDGEEKDIIFGTLKPHVRAQRGDILLCSDSSLKHSDLSCEILNVYPFNTAIGKPVLLRALRAGRAEISGPENNSQLSEILTDMRRHGAGTIFIDGAADRTTQVAQEEKPVFVYVAKVEPENLDLTASEIKLVWATAGVPLWKTGDRTENAFLSVDGALTPEKVPPRTENSTTLIVEDPTKIFLSWSEWQALNARFQVFFRRKPDLAAFIVNLYNVSRREFEKKLASPALTERIVYNPYQITATGC